MQLFLAQKNQLLSFFIPNRFPFYYPHTSVICVLLWAEKLTDY